MINRSTPLPPAERPFAKPAASSTGLHAVDPAPPAEVSPAVAQMMEQLRAANEKIRALEAAVAARPPVDTPHVDDFVPAKALSALAVTPRTLTNWALKGWVESKIIDGHRYISRSSLARRLSRLRGGR